MSSRWDRARIGAEIAKLVAEVYSIIIDKDLAKKNDEKDRKIAALEAEINELKKKLEAK